MKNFKLFLIIAISICISPEIVNSLTYSLINIHNEMEYFDDSCDVVIRKLTQEILSNPSISENYYERARCYYEEGEYDKAINDLTISINLKEMKNNLYDRAIVYKQMFDINNSNVLLARLSLNDFLKVQMSYPDFNKGNVIKYIMELKSIIGSDITTIQNYEYLGEGLYVFYLNKFPKLYIKFPEILPSATFNIIKQHRTKTGKGSGEFLMLRGTFQQFLDSLVPCFNNIESENKLLIITIDDKTGNGIQERIKYGTDTNNLNKPDEHYTWFSEPVNDYYPRVTGWLKFEELYTPNDYDELPENYISHNGKLKIRVLKGSKPVKIIESSVSCAKNKTHVVYENAVYEISTDISDCDVTQINLRLALPEITRWLLDKWYDPLMMPDYHLEINGKIFPNKMQYVIESNKGQSVDFIVNLTKINK